MVCGALLTHEKPITPYTDYHTKYGVSWSCGMRLYRGSTQKIWSHLYRSLKATGTDMVRSGNYDFLIVIVIHINYGLILYHVSSDSGGKLHIFHKLYFMTLLSVLLSKFDNIFWLQKLE